MKTIGMKNIILFAVSAVFFGLCSVLFLKHSSSLFFMSVSVILYLIAVIEKVKVHRHQKTADTVFIFLPLYLPFAKLLLWFYRLSVEEKITEAYEIHINSSFLKKVTDKRLLRKAMEEELDAKRLSAPEGALFLWESAIKPPGKYRKLLNSSCMTYCRSGFVKFLSLLQPDLRFKKRVFVGAFYISSKEACGN